VGVLWVVNRTARRFTRAQQAFLARLADQAAVAIANARLYAEVRERLRQATELLEITRVLNSTLDFTEVLRETTRRAAQAVGMDRCSMFLWDQGAVRPVMSQFADGHADPALWAAFRALGRVEPEAVPAFAEAVRQGAPVVVADATRSALVPRPWVTTFDLRTLLVVPMVRQDTVVGVLQLDDTGRPRPVRESQVALAMTLAGQVSLVVDNARLYAESQQALAALRAKNAELDSFVSVVSHDLKAPLVTMQGMAEIVLADCGDRLDADGRRYLARIQANAQHMERLILDLLALARIGREARPPGRVSLDAVLDDVLGDLAAPIRDRGVTVVRGPLPEVWAVRTQIEQVLANLVSNAVKYLGDQPAPRVEIGAVARDGHAECFVADNGIGIDPAYHDRVFEMFHRLKEVQAEGTGVGLAIVRKIVEGAGGRVWLESARGRGTTVRFTWPTEPPGAPPRRRGG